MAKFCADQAEAAGAEAGEGADAARLLWSVLRVLAAHQGRLSSAPYSLLPAPSGGGFGSGKQLDPTGLPEAQLSAALLEDLPPASGADLLLPTAAPAPAAAAAAAAQVQQLMLEARREEALRWGGCWAVPGAWLLLTSPSST